MFQSAKYFCVFLHLGVYVNRNCHFIYGYLKFKISWRGRCV